MVQDATSPDEYMTPRRFSKVKLRVGSLDHQMTWDSNEEHNFYMPTQFLRKKRSGTENRKLSTHQIDSPHRIVNMDKIRKFQSQLSMTAEQAQKEGKKYTIKKFGSEQIPKIKLVNPAMRPPSSILENSVDNKNKQTPRKSMESAEFQFKFAL